MGSVVRERLGSQSIRVPRSPRSERASSFHLGVSRSRSLSILFLSGLISTSQLGLTVSNRPLKVTLGATLNLEMENFKLLPIAWERTWEQSLWASDPDWGCKSRSSKILILLSSPESRHLVSIFR